MIRWLAKHLRYLADRLDPDGAPRSTGITFHFQQSGRRGIVFQWEGEGCPLYILRDFPDTLWYRDRDEYNRRHIE